MFFLLWPSSTSHHPLSRHTVGLQVLQAQSLHCPKAHILLLHLLESHGGTGVSAGPWRGGSEAPLTLRASVALAGV